MHGRPRKAPTPEEEKTLAVKATNLRALQSQFLQFHHDQIYTTEALGVSSKLLEANPEFYSAWNYRKLAVQHNLTQLQANPDSNSDSIQSIFDEELRLVENALKRNFKSYGAWHHRKWILSKGHSSTDRELRLLDLFQKQDSRNFHAWNYRRFIAGLRNISHEDELKVTTVMISDNFSNYSAWHNRSVLLSELLKEKAQGYYPKENVLTEEYDFVRNILTEEYDFVRSALFTDPDDQSGWFYHLWLLDQTVKNNSNLLVSSWPPHGSNLYTATDDYYPLVLHFNEPVEGVNSSTVTIEGEKDQNSNYTWSPISTNNNSFAQTWITQVKSRKVKIAIGNSRGITSLSSAQISHPINIEFTVNIQPRDSEHDVESIISWRDQNFQIWTVSNLLESFNVLCLNEDDKPASQWNLKTTTEEISHFRDLLSWSDCKIGKLTLARLLMAHESMTSSNNQNIHKEVLELYRDLVKLDPPHSQFYKDEYSIVLLKQVTSQESILSYCRQYKDTNSSNVERSICLRLNNLSLSRIGSFEKLLWVRMLDLSHNQLQSIEGLESMQLLTCLNLSNNKITSFTALDPLRLIKSLKVLDISHNEIGSHTIDTRRYLCASPLSHTVSNYLKFDEIDTSDLTITNYWEAFSVLSGSNLTQLDIMGNLVAEDDRFILFLRRLLPGLKWLDGQNVALNSS